MSAPEAHEGPAAPHVAEAPSAPEADGGSIERPIDLRLTRLHLRMGSLELARAELEALAGAGALDTGALIDLAEARWRTGDLPGAGVAANAYLAVERDDTLALIIAAEASAAAGHPGESRQLVAQVLGRDGLDLDAVFAGMPRSWMWPLEPTDEPVAMSELFPDAVRPMADAAPVAPAAAPAPGAPEVKGAPEAEAIEVAEPGPAAIDASAAAVPAGPARIPVGELAAARSALAAGDAEAAADRLGALLRARPDLAAGILDALERTAAPGPAAGAEDRSRGDAPQGEER